MEPKIVMDYYRGYEAKLSVTAVLECWTRVLMISLLFVRIIAMDTYIVLTQEGYFCLDGMEEFQQEEKEQPRRGKHEFESCYFSETNYLLDQ